MMVEIAVGHWQQKRIAKSANVYVSQMTREKLLHVIEKLCFFEF